jgi:hypothetical protein
LAERQLLFDTIEAQVEPTWTELMYRKIRRSSSEMCGCGACRVWATRRDQALCETCRGYIQRLGVNLGLDTGNSPILLDGELLYLAQYRVKGTLIGRGQYACATCGTKIWVEQDRWERHIILLNVAVTLVLDAGQREMVESSSKGSRT